MQQISVAVLTILEISSIVRLESAGIPFCRNVTPEDDSQNEVDYNAVAIDNSTDVPSHQNYEEPIESDPGHPLFLTPYIKSGQLQVARNLSYVGALDGIKTNSYSGYLTVNQEYESNLFFWFFPVEKNDSEVPLLLWLQGGPGMSALFGVFVEHGPFFVTKNGKLRSRSSHWAQLVNMLYIDNPVGTGFSFTKDERGYAENQEDVAGNLYEALQQFFTLFPEYQDNEFHIAGESYGGKFAVSLAAKIHDKQEECAGARTCDHSSRIRINLKGMIIGGGYIDFCQFFGYAELLYTIGLIDEKQRDHVQDQEDMQRSCVDAKDWHNAYVFHRTIMKYIFETTGVQEFHNIVKDFYPNEFNNHVYFLRRNETQKALNVNSHWYEWADTNHDWIFQDFAMPVTSQLKHLLEYDYRFLFYHGQLDIIFPYAATKEFLLHLQSPNSTNANSERRIWRDEKNYLVLGYIDKFDNITEVLVRNAGHYVPFDAPAATFNMIKKYFGNNL